MMLSLTKLNWRSIILLLAVPAVALSLVSGLNLAGLGRFMTRSESVLHWLTIIPPFWLSQIVGSWIVLSLDKQRQLPMWSALLLGGLLGNILARPYFYYNFSLSAASLPSNVDLGPQMHLIPQDWDMLLRYAQIYLPGTVMWAVLGSVVARLINWQPGERVRHENQPSHMPLQDAALSVPLTNFM